MATNKNYPEYNPVHQPNQPPPQHPNYIHQYQPQPYYPPSVHPNPPVVVAPVVISQVSMSSPNFQVSILGCCQDWTSCNSIFCTPCGMYCAVGEAYAMAKKDSCFGAFCTFWCCGCIGAALYRNKIQMHYQMNANMCVDICCMSCCLLCAVSQLYREVKKREMIPRNH